MFFFTEDKRKLLKETMNNTFNNLPVDKDIGHPDIENEEDDEVIDMTTSIEMDIKKYLLIFILCFVVTIVLMVLIS